MTGSRGRPRTFDEEVVLDRAVEVFWSSGYRDTTTRQLESALGVSQSSLYNAFGSKQGLMDAALDRYEDRVGAALLAPLEDGGSGLDDIDAFFDSLARTVTAAGRGGCMIINLMAEDGGADPRLTERTAAYRARIRHALHTALQHAAAAGGTAPDQLDERADILFGVTLGINVLARGGASRDDLAPLVAAAHHLVASWRS